MSISISGKHIDVGDSLKAHIEGIVSGISHRYSGELIEAHIVVTKETHLFRVEFSAHISQHFVVRSHGDDTDAYRACDLAGERMESRIKRYKSRLRDRKRHGNGEDHFIQAQQYIVNADDEDKGEDTPLIIAEMTSTVPTLTVGEAVMRMDLSDHHVMMFKNSKHGGFNVVFKRADGHIGWIDPSIKKD
jgi:ribosomal subunit interface protein